jgi:hypothetical protein
MEGEMTAKDRRIENERDDAYLAGRAGMVPAAWKELALVLWTDRKRSQARVDAAIAALRRLGEELP